MGWFGKCTAAAANEELVLMSLGVYAVPEKRDATLPKAMVAEIYSPPESQKSSGEGAGRGAASFPDSPST